MQVDKTISVVEVGFDDQLTSLDEITQELSINGFNVNAFDWVTPEPTSDPPPDDPVADDTAEGDNVAEDPATNDPVADFDTDQGDTQSEYTEISVQAAEALIDTTDDLIILDVREPDEFCGAGGHIPGAVNYPYNSDVLAQKYRELPINEPILVVCGSGMHSRKSASFLVERGFEEVYDLEEGMAGWTDETIECSGVEADIDTANAPDETEEGAISNTDEAVSDNHFEYKSDDGTVSAGCFITVINLFLPRS